MSDPKITPLKKNTSPHSLRIWPLFVLVLVLVAAFLLALLLLQEVIARNGFLDKISAHESLGIYPSPMGQYFDIKWYGLEDFVARNEGVDVIVIGSSVVNTGIDPDIVAETYFKLTGTHLRIYNFGVEGFDIVPNSVYAKVLAQKYHPAVIICGMVPRDYLASDNADVNQQFLMSPWIKYKSGNWNLAGFLIDHSAALRHYLPYRNWMRSDFLETFYALAHRYSRTSSSGYEPDNYIATTIEQPPDPNNPDEQETFAKYHNFTIAPSRSGDLQSILNLQKTGDTRIIVMEMPLHPTFYDYMGGLTVYQKYQQDISTVVTASGALFLASNGEPQIPTDGRSDRGHLNKIGAPVFSTYLGIQLANLTFDEHFQFTKSVQGGQ